MEPFKRMVKGASSAVVEKSYGIFREFPLLLIIIIGAAGFWGWKQSQHIDHICHNLFAAFDDTARGPGYSFTLDFEETVTLLSEMPTLKNAAQRCHQVRDYMAAYDVLAD